MDNLNNRATRLRCGIAGVPLRCLVFVRIESWHATCQHEMIDMANHEAEINKQRRSEAVRNRRPQQLSQHEILIQKLFER
uniref:Uncharacterized protein n=1 Tax=Acrobeloides nanus TaxID=290746 RepID=A0A914C6M2_9BILA